MTNSDKFHAFLCNWKAIDFRNNLFFPTVTRFENPWVCILGLNKEIRECFFYPEAATGGVLLEKVFLKISQISQENTYVAVIF